MMQTRSVRSEAALQPTNTQCFVCNVLPPPSPPLSTTPSLGYAGRYAGAWSGCLVLRLGVVLPGWKTEGGMNKCFHALVLLFSFLQCAIQALTLHAQTHTSSSSSNPSLGSQTSFPGPRGEICPPPPALLRLPSPISARLEPNNHAPFLPPSLLLLHSIMALRRLFLSASAMRPLVASVADARVSQVMGLAGKSGFDDKEHAMEAAYIRVSEEEKGGREGERAWHV